MTGTGKKSCSAHGEIFMPLISYKLLTVQKDVYKNNPNYICNQGLFEARSNPEFYHYKEKSPTKTKQNKTERTHNNYGVISLSEIVFLNGTYPFRNG